MGQDGSQPNGRGKDQIATVPSAGTLYVVSMPIGHPDDITLRALAILRRVSVIASEDPRVTQSLLVHHGITTAITSYGPKNREEKVLLLLQRLIQGHDVALVSDNGTPVIYDPGSFLVAAAYQAGISVTTIPGPSTLTAATAISGLSGDAIIFEGHLPRTSRRLEQFISQFRKERRTLVFYVEPLALTRLLKIMIHALPARKVFIAMNLTTGRETVGRGNPEDLLAQIKRMPKSSAVTMVIEGHAEHLHRKKAGRKTPRTTRRLVGGQARERSH